MDPRLSPQPDPVALHHQVYQELRHRFAIGEITPDATFSTRGLAAEMNVSQMPVREALSRLAAEGAVDIRSKRRLAIPRMTRDRFEDLLTCRLLLEPAAARGAVGKLDAAGIRLLRSIDDKMGAALANGDVASYMSGNYDFHFTLYRASGRPTMTRLIETLWLQFGPFMRVVYGRWGTATLVDQHQVAIAALTRGDANALSEAIHADIADGMGMIGRGILQDDEDHLAPLEPV